MGESGAHRGCELERRLLGHQFAKEPKAKLMDQQSVARRPVQKPPLDPDVADTAPSDPVLTAYDEEHLITYLRLLDADIHVMSVLGPIAAYFVPNWQRRFMPTRYHVAGARVSRYSN
jgi:hypothetical protein